MTDIVERLRNFCVWNSRHSHYDPVPVCQEAADEIERLRADQPQSIAGRGREIGKAIRDYLQKKHGTAAVQVSSDGIERIYYNGVALNDLADAISAPPEQPAPGTRRDDVIAECAAIADQYDDCGGSFIAQKIRDLYSSAPAKSSSGDKETQA